MWGAAGDVRKRWWYHRAPGRWKHDGEKHGMKICTAFRDHGLENFQFKLIEACAPSKLSAREIWWIAKLKPEYNSTVGGFGRAIGKRNGQKAEQIKSVSVSRYLHRRLKARAVKLCVTLQSLFARIMKWWLSLGKKRRRAIVEQWVKRKLRKSSAPK